MLKRIFGCRTIISRVLIRGCVVPEPVNTALSSLCDLNRLKGVSDELRLYGRMCL